ncbi:2-phospho-L-lactate transferase [Hamadaea sp. NPDC050747]|uniref:2-phospho-L-lactate transferase n=1 Tax=Hamadaea sp. NPDC050747 TaxID=3155789 RepID=UPI0033FBCF93
MRMTVIAGGIGGARFLQGVRAYARTIGGEVTAIVNVGDDVTLHGLRICPDLDSVMYTLGGGNDAERGWGRAKETWTVKEELAAYGLGPEWFGLGDRDIATHLTRSVMLTAGYPLSQVTEALNRRWQPGVRMIPATDDKVETHVVISAADAADQGLVTSETATAALEGGEYAMHFQEWWVRYRAGIPAKKFVFVGSEQAAPAPGVVDSLTDTDVVLIAPSNPVVSVAPVLAIPGVRSALLASRGPVVGVSPIIAGAPVRGMADKCLAAIGVDCTAQAVGQAYGARGSGGILDAWLVDTSDAGIVVPGVTVRSTPLWMTDEDATAAMVRAALTAGGVV